MKRRTLQEYMEWLLVGRRVRLNGEPAVLVDEVRVEPGGWLIVYHDGTHSQYRLDHELVAERED